ncbi:MAG: hypothetical protein RR162_04320 [Oscillospiraceae bacterium]
MKATFKNNLKITLVYVSIIVLLVGGAILNIFFGNPISKNIAKKHITGYVETTYEGKEFTLSKPSYSVKDMGYHIYVTSHISEDTQFTVSYCDGEITDNYKECVADKNNTWSRLNAEFDYEVIEVFTQKYTADIVYAGLGEQGKTYENLQLDMPLDMGNLPMPSFVSIHMKNDDITWEGLAATTVDINEYFIEKGITIDYYDVVLTAKAEGASPSEVGAYEFPASLLKSESLPQVMKEHNDKMISGK